MRKSYWLATLLAACAAPTVREREPQGQVAFPTGYRDWTHVKSMVVLEGHVHYDAFGGVHHVYANDKALVALKERQPFPKGAVLVFDLLQERMQDGAIVEDARKVTGVMEKDPGRFPDTEGWGFEDFARGDPLRGSVTDMRTQCLACHETQRASDFVYSRYRE